MSFKTGEFTPWKSEENGNKQRMAGDYLSDFVNANDKKDEQKDFTYQGSNGKDYGTNTEKMLFGNSSTSSQPSASGTVEQPANTLEKNLATKPASTPAASKYNEADYKYYVSDFGSGNGAQAYAKDMESYNSMVAMNKGDSPAAGHLGLVAQMTHPDWGQSQKTGGGNPILDIDYSKPSEYYQRTQRGVNQAR